MARFTSVIGLTEKAEKFLEENCAKRKFKVYDDESGECVSEYEVFKKVNGLFTYYDPFNPIDPEVKLSGYELKDGRVVYEIEAGDIWSSGPNIFLNLVDEDGNSIDPSLDWTLEEMEKAVD